MLFLRFACSLALLCTSLAHAATLTQTLAASAPDADPQAIAQALEASNCAVLKLGVKAPKRLALVDYSRPSVDRRLWVFDLQAKTLLFSDYVAHGRGSGENFARVFSNIEGSFQSSLGLFVTAESYFGAHGRSLRLDGLEPGINDQARARAIVLHGADYVDPKLGQLQGRIGRSHGCPAVRPKMVEKVIDSLEGGQMLYAYYTDPRPRVAKTMALSGEPRRGQSALMRCELSNSRI